jgi:alpha-2-macroglobulin-like protein
MRHRLIGSVLVCLFSASIFAARYSANSPILRVNESATKFSLKKEGAVVSLAVENSGSSALTARVKLELIDPRDAVRATAMIEASILPGSGVSTVPMVKIGAGDYDVKELLWHRLRYEIAAIDSSGKETDSVSGLISLSEITSDIFRLLVSAPQEVGKEAKYAVRARALHPLTGKPVPGVNVEASMAYEEGDDERDLKSSGVTNSTGEALLEFKLPGPLKADDVEIKVVARRDGFLQEAEEEVSLLYPNQVLPESWFELLGAARKRAEIKAGDAGQVVFDFRAVASVKDGKQRVTAFGSDASDAVEKPVSVHPDGEEVAQTASEVFGESGSLDMVVPMDAIKGSVRAELKIYPNLMAHALEGIEGILQRPYGCAEQTISSTYPNVMILRYLEPQSEKLSAPMRKTAEKARRYAQAGYERLLGYRAESGGFSYWGRGEADLALTAYALRFLNDAGDFIGVDEDVIADARKFILSSQQPDGRWLPHYWSESEDPKRTALNTAFIARVLAMEKSKEAKADKALAAALSRALDYLAKRIEAIDEPYLIASYALAAMDAGEKKGAEKAVVKLRTLARDEAGTSYWNLESNTPFYGWGLAGRIETTALAVNALKRAGAAEIGKAGERDKAESLTNRGLLFLLRNKDRYGVWLSTQATINALDTLISLNEGEVAMSGATGVAEIVVNGKRVSSAAMPPGGQLSNPITVELSSFLSRGNNRVEIRRPGNAARASAQVVETHYEPWGQGASERRENIKLRNSSALRLAVNYDKLEAKIGEEVVCKVTAERVGHYGYGMMLAEIGLPPGADVDRESLERAAQESGRSLNHYDVLPDRVIAYLWPQAGGLKFSFKFKPRYGVKAQTSPSALYDYYNPEARVALAPSRFVVK